MTTPGDTSLGGGRRDFPATTVGLLSRLSGSSPFDPRSALELLASRYWKPAYLFLRSAKAKSNEDAKDLTQAFFLWLMEGAALRRYEPQRGGFRTYLKVLLRGFVGHQEEAAGALKRGGGTALLNLDAESKSLEATIAASSSLDPEQLFDRAWLSEIIAQAVGRVREKFVASGREAQFRAFEEHDQAPADAKPSYADLASRHGVKATDIRNQLFSVREAIRTEVRAELGRLTADDGELEEEWNALFGS